MFSSLGSDGAIDLHELGFQGAVGGDWGIPRLSRDQARTDRLGVGRWITRFLDVGQPTIAAINGGPEDFWREVSASHHAAEVSAVLSRSSNE